jgi:ADP-ribose pyrophosphatase YjhB (NUDIX family)
MDGIRFCPFCGESFVRSPQVPQLDLCQCNACGRIISTPEAARGPAALVLAILFANDRILMLKRGTAPYRGKWALPGGFVEAGESVEVAAVREVWEETRLKLSTTQLLPKGVMSLGHLNQIHHIFTAHLDGSPEATAMAPEALEVRWFSEAECIAGTTEFWDPAATVDYVRLFRTLLERRRDLFQWNDDYQRIISADGPIEYVWRREDGGC